MGHRKEIIMSGVGGQGLLVCGRLLGEAAAVYDHMHATQSSDYGVETRGTFTKSDVIISDGDIYFPDVTEPDMIICLAQVAYDRYSGKVPERTLVVYDGGQMTADPSRGAHEKDVRILEISKEAGSPAAANIVMMGVIAGYTGAVTRDAAEHAIANFFSKKSEKVIAMNDRAFDMGYEAGKNLQ